MKEILEPSPVGELRCSKDQLDDHLQATYGDSERGKALGVLAGLPDFAPEPEVAFNMKPISWKEHQAVVEKARARSAPGPNAIPYLVYKRCPKISRNLWNLNRSAFKYGRYPENCRWFEGVYIPKGEGDFTPATGRPISLGNVQGKIYLGTLARRLTEFVVENGYVDRRIQKGGVPGVSGCVEHFGAMWETLKDARIMRRDLSVVWLDLANAYGAVPHLLIIKALRFYRVPQPIVDIVLSYFSGVFGRFSSKEVTSNWQQFEVGIFMGCVISVILFVLCMNLVDEYLTIKIPRSVAYVKDGTPVPPLKLFMDDSCLVTATESDMQVLLSVFGEFVEWARFTVKSSKSRALVLVGGRVVESVSLSFGGELIPNVTEKPIKFLGRWIRADVKDTVAIEETGRQLKVWMGRLDESGLSGLEKCWGYQYLVLPKMKWPLAIYDTPLTTVAAWEQNVNSFLRKWLGAGHSLSRLCLFNTESSVRLPLDSLQDTWKVEKCRLQQTYTSSQDEVILALQPLVRSGRKWKATEELEEAASDVRCEVVRGMIPPHPRAGIGFGEWRRPWEKLSDRERRGVVIERVRERIDQERTVESFQLEVQGLWLGWREEVVPMEFSWRSLFDMEERMVGFILRAVYGTLVVPSLAKKWKEGEDGLCKLCGDAPGSIRHILTGCKVALGQGRYRWRHDKVLRQIGEQVQFHCEVRANAKSRPLRESRSIEFVAEGKRGKKKAKKRATGCGILSGAKDWVVLSDIGGQLKFPAEIAQTRLRPDLVVFSREVKTVIWWELTCPSEERIGDAHTLKIERYADLERECEANGWKCFNMAVEVGARGQVAESLSRAASRLGFRGRGIRKLVRDTGREAAHCSMWIYFLSAKKEWEYRKVE